MIERLWESIIDIWTRLDHQAPVQPIAVVPPIVGEAVLVAPPPPPPGVEVPPVVPILRAVPARPASAEESTTLVEKFLQLGHLRTLEVPTQIQQSIGQSYSCYIPVARICTEVVEVEDANTVCREDRGHHYLARVLEGISLHLLPSSDIADQEGAVLDFAVGESVSVRVPDEVYGVEQICPVSHP
ncbi:hypothetical protein Taro_038682 [Colocasia esculenta]|uniref:Uncharacterized protein n=1 Tax=Colocasia esculenta TaxID=4460 RepID=A0A843WEK5_COLES|nr:hypothetical protein [Colocasia esculenta]